MYPTERACPSNPNKGVTYNILKQNTYFWRYKYQVMAEFKALSIYQSTKNSSIQSSAWQINSDWTALAITGFHLLKGVERWKNLVAFKRHSAYGFLPEVIINAYIENEKAFWVNNATNLSPGFSPQEAIPSIIKVSTHCFLLMSIM